MTVSLLKPQVLEPVPGVTAGFTTREGGSSTGPLTSLNLGLGVGDPRERVDEHRSQVLQALGRPDATWVSLRQAHGDTVVQVTHRAGRSIEADGVWTSDHMATVAVLVADCLPILIAEASGAAIAAVHAGWRGTQARIAEAMVKRLSQAGHPPEQLRVAMGPAIGPCCFEIGDDVAEQLEAAVEHDGSAIVRAPEGRVTADLWALNRSILMQAGVKGDAIDAFRICTCCSESFFSHRRDNGKTGRQAGVIGFASA